MRLNIRCVTKVLMLRNSITLKTSLELIVLSNLENLNAEFIRQGLPQSDRLRRLNQLAISQLKSLANNPSIKQLENNSDGN